MQEDGRLVELSHECIIQFLRAWRMKKKGKKANDEGGFAGLVK